MTEKTCSASGTSSMGITTSLALIIVSYQIVRKVLPWLYSNIIGPKFLGPKVNFKKLGEWAVITGATDGIGKAYAKALAKKGLNVVLISRSLSKLETVAKEIADDTKVEVKIIDVDFTAGPEIYEKIQTNLEGLDIGVLINNVGISYQHPEYFITYTDENETFLRDIVAANIHSVTFMTKMILPRLVAKKQGVIVNVSSLAAVIPNPLLSVYSGTKAFVDKFSEDLHQEYKDQGIIIQSVRPGFVATNMSKVRKTSAMIPSPDCYASSALKTVGITGQTTGYWPHAVMGLVIDTVSSVLGRDFAQNMVFNQLKATRKKALRNAKKN
ncbi:very-long-chain 3-oxoacyl-CoA reductase [Episyrphus balteatus]|uniref:very-long-chain 3-oxoacyl-CoA reductase n=1 Tax=Episyrphus balteatus TaxID=286459 RepID=UPI002486974B|nr:very-long-chain 3-oxoacyl-CoA reductase [Episyrphus balteatus]